MTKKKEQVVLEGLLREGRGKQAAREVRGGGNVPGVVYGEGKEAVSIAVEAKLLSKALHTKAGENVLINLCLKGAAKPQEMAVLVKELQLHPVSHHIIHVDFHRVSLTKKITVAVPLSFKGEPEGVRLEGGLLEHLRWEVEVVCLPTEIPSDIPVDVTNLKVGQTIFARDVQLPSGVNLVTDPALPVASCEIPREEAAAPVAEEAAAEPEVLKQKKPEEIAAEDAQKAQKQEEKGQAKEKAQTGEKSTKERGGSAK